MDTLALALVAWLQTGPPGTPYDDYRAEQAAGPHADWAAGGATGLLETLRRHRRILYLIDRDSRRGFVAESDLPGLVALLDSGEPCAVVLQPISAHLPTRPSTVGHEAALLIEAFRQGRYPLSPASDLRHVDEEGLRDWWALWRKLGPAQEWRPGPGGLESGAAYVGDFRLAAGWEPVVPIPLPYHHAGRIQFANLDAFGALRFGLWKEARLTFRIVKTEVTAAGEGAWRTLHTAEILRLE